MIDWILGIPTLNRPDTLIKLIESVKSGSFQPHTIAIIDNSGGYVLQELAKQDFSGVSSKIVVSVQDKNLGVAGSWNALLQFYKDYPVIISNDDLEFHTDSLELMTHYYDNTGLICGASTSGNAFSLFYLPYRVYEAVGPFDDAFYPAYFEDNDYAYRMKLMGIPILEIPEVTYNHVGSATLKAFTPSQESKHHEQFRNNRLRYINKWGGEPMYETFKIQWDGKYTS